MIFWAPGRSPLRSSACSRAWSWRHLRAISTFGPRTIRGSSRRSSDSARTYRNIHFQSGIRTESSCKTFVTCRRRPIGPSRGRATMIPRQRTIGSRRLGRHDGFDSCREKHQPWPDCCPSSADPSLGFLAIRCVFWRQDVECCRATDVGVGHCFEAAAREGWLGASERGPRHSGRAASAILTYCASAL